MAKRSDIELMSERLQMAVRIRFNGNYTLYVDCSELTQLIDIDGYTAVYQCQIAPC